MNSVCLAFNGLVPAGHPSCHPSVHVLSKQFIVLDTTFFFLTGFQMKTYSWFLFKTVLNFKPRELNSAGLNCSSSKNENQIHAKCWIGYDYDVMSPTCALTYVWLCAPTSPCFLSKNKMPIVYLIRGRFSLLQLSR